MKNFYTFEDMGVFTEFLNEKVSNNDELFTIIITSGSMAPEVIEIVKKDNSSGQRANILLFTSSKKTNQKHLDENP